MKLLCTGDWHLFSNSRPENRTDADYIGTQNKKVTYILDYALDNNVSAILQPGDFFDTHFVPYGLVNGLIEKMNSDFHCFINIFTVFGQHDLRYHSLKHKDNTPLSNMELAGAVKIASEQPHPISDFSDIHIYGASWGEPIPKILDEDKINILILHKMIVNDKLWAQQEGHTYCSAMLRNTKFNLIVSGDNHQQFTWTYRTSRHLVNAGSLMRATKAQTEHRPAFYIWDSDDRSITRHEIPVDPIEEVMDLGHIEEEREKDSRMDALAERIKSGKKLSFDFTANVRKAMDDNNVTDGVRDIIEEVFENV